MLSQIKNLLKRGLEIDKLTKQSSQLHQRITDIEYAIDTMLESPEYIETDTLGFNGQKIRKEIFKQITSQIKFDTIIETGTWLGNTTGFMAQNSHLPVYSAEIIKRSHLIAKNRLKKLESIMLELSDSRSFLIRCSNNENLNKRRVFFYLDAHWYEDLPLFSEIEIISNTWDEFVIMIDDFKVPDDKGYGYDDYGPNKSLSLDYIMPTIKKHDLCVFFPSISSTEETGAKRGCAIICKNNTIAKILDQTPLITKRFRE